MQKDKYFNVYAMNNIKTVVDNFYKKILQDEMLREFFVDIAQVNWDEHLPKMYAFWDSILNGSGAYKGNPMLVHFPVNDVKHIERHHFDRWLTLWKETCAEILPEEQAATAIQKATNIAGIMSIKMDNAAKKV